ncbi:AMP-binding enzyme [Paenibacillus mucilaginosus]|uniref:AMP-binding enzyme n=1 Tax=Paenibacillus mucilaginosus TaxID=61624 RepID=UPI003D247655
MTETSPLVTVSRLAHPAVFEACVIRVPHVKWDERPLAFVSWKEGAEGTAGKEELLAFLGERFVKWWIPDDVVVLKEIPRTSVGKFMKRELRGQYKDHYQSGDGA